jgi:bifunctional NMN adenylyltransferase/nudix hydrolase
MTVIDREAVGVIRGRFQVPELHEGHRYLFEYVLERHADVLVVLSDPYIANSADPLSFLMQKMMIQSTYPNRQMRFAECGRLPSSRWMRSKVLDAAIEREFPGRKAILYGSRESIVHSYDGAFEKHETETVFSGSGTKIRNAIEIVDSTDFRKGVIYAAVHRRPIGYPAVDVAVMWRNQNQVLLVGWEEEEGKLRFPGSFFEFGRDTNYEAAGMRCLKKELPGIRFSSLQLIASHTIHDDYRYKRSQDGIITTFMTVSYSDGVPKPGQGIDRVKWVKFADVQKSLVESHKPLGKILKSRWYG